MQRRRALPALQTLEGAHRPTVDECARRDLRLLVESEIGLGQCHHRGQPQRIQNRVRFRHGRRDPRQNFRERWHRLVDPHVGAAGDFAQRSHGFVQRRGGGIGDVQNKYALVPSKRFSVKFPQWHVSKPQAKLPASLLGRQTKALSIREQDQTGRLQGRVIFNGSVGVLRPTDGARSPGELRHLMFRPRQAAHAEMLHDPAATETVPG
mmetsp:Transcript_54533/g.115838  ORF Transcript_54533/g.115838 Transcript_54533/m.115838 type:complete len:208 (+) Transcript_54533:2612-3235(+)